MVYGRSEFDRARERQQRLSNNYYTMPDLRGDCVASLGYAISCSRRYRKRFIRSDRSLFSAWTNADAAVATPLGGFLLFKGPLGAAQQIATGTLASVISKNPATDQLLTATLAACSGVCQPGTLIHNTTHDSYAWLNTNTSGNIWVISQPMTQFAEAEVDTWANSDTYFAYTLSTFTFNRLGSLTSTEFANVTNTLTGSSLGSTSFAESSIDPYIGQPIIDTIAICDNCDIPVNSIVWNGGTFVFIAGQYRGANNMQGLMSLQSDFLVSGLNVVPRDYSVLDKVWLQNSNMITIGLVAVSGYIAGNSKIQIEPGSALDYAGTLTTATATFLSTASPIFQLITLTLSPSDTVSSPHPTSIHSAEA